MIFSYLKSSAAIYCNQPCGGKAAIIANPHCYGWIAKVYHMKLINGIDTKRIIAYNYTRIQ